MNGATLPLSQLATLRVREGADADPALQPRARGRPSIADAQRGFNIGKLTAADHAAARPDGLAARLPLRRWAARPRPAREAFGGIGIAIIVAIFGIFAILVLEFGNFKSTLIVLTVVPLGVFGGLLMLLRHRQRHLVHRVASASSRWSASRSRTRSCWSTSPTSCASRACRSTRPSNSAGEIRFLPILLTSATAIGGLLPLALQNIGLYSPMAWVIIGGLITSTLLARLVTPVMYKLIPPEGHEPVRLESPAGAPQGASGALL